MQDRPQDASEAWKGRHFDVNLDKVLDETELANLNKGMILKLAEQNFSPFTGRGPDGSASSGAKGFINLKVLQQLHG